MSQIFGDVTLWATGVVYSFGYPGVAVLTAMSSLFLPVPSQLVLPLAGFLVSQRSFSFPLVWLVATAGSSGASLVPYALGRRLGEERLRRFVRRFGRFVLVDESGFDKASGWFVRRGGVTVLICRLVPGVGSFISVPAGIERMPVWKFLIYTTLGSGTWNAAFIALGWALGAQWALVRQYYAPTVEYAALTVIAGALLWFMWRQRKKTRE